MYINNVKKARFITFGWIQLILGGLHSLFGLLGIIDMFTDFQSVKTIWGVFIMWAILGVIFLFLGIRNFIMIKHCNAMGGALLSDDDGFVSVPEMAFRLGVSEEKAVRILQLLIRKGCLVHVVVDFKSGKPVVILQEVPDRLNNSGQFQVVYCPNCGNACSIKTGMVNKCNACGGLIKL